MDLDARLEKELGALKEKLGAPIEVTVTPTTPWRVYAVATSTGFDDMEELERQVLVWGWLRERLPDELRDRVEFVFTVSPNDPPQDIDDASGTVERA